jgi:hypothetical protein
VFNIEKKFLTMECLPLFKIEAMKRFMLDCLASSRHHFIAVSSIGIHAENAKNRQNFPTHL